MSCDHSGPHSGALRYLRTQGQLRLVIVCDACGQECAELGQIEYRIRALEVAGGRERLGAPPLHPPATA